MQTQSSVEIDRPIDEVFEYTNKNVAQWSMSVVEDNVIESKNDGGIGTTFQCITEEKGRRMEFHGLVTKYEPPTRSAVRLNGQHFDIEAEYIFEDLGGRTRLTQNAAVMGKGFTKVMFVLFGWLMKKSG